MTQAEMASQGGQAIKKKLGAEGYAKLGKLSGAARRKKKKVVKK